MTYSLPRLVFISALTLLTLPLATHAQGVSVDTSASVSVQTAPLTPLQKLRMQMEAAKHNALDANIEVRADAKMGPRGMSMGDRHASTTGAMPGFRALVHLHGGLIKMRLELAARQFEKMMERIQSRIDKLKAAGADTVSVQASLDAAKSANVQAKADVKAVADYVASITDTSDRATVKAELEAKIKTAQTSIKAAHSALMKTVRALVDLAKTIHVETSTEATTTVQ